MLANGWEARTDCYCPAHLVQAIRQLSFPGVVMDACFGRDKRYCLFKKRLLTFEVTDLAESQFLGRAGLTRQGTRESTVGESKQILMLIRRQSNFHVVQSLCAHRRPVPCAQKTLLPCTTKFSLVDITTFATDFCIFGVLQA